MKNQFAGFCVIFLLSVLIGCSVLPKDSKSLYIMKALAPGTKLSISLEDKSAFDMDIRNTSKDTLILKRANHKDQIIANNKISIAVDPKVDIEVLNISGKEIKPTVRIYNHKSKVIYEVSNIK
ncbi:hypothetical protein [Pedobacter nototheniae]|uniref:hypothetical protein n=1 Tax=Pedobacter nototheniae TaxID=2488994 RepID=UPI00293165B7|nr:hypothetical protein [Pedobacter nototheniae]